MRFYLAVTTGRCVPSAAAAVYYRAHGVYCTVTPALLWRTCLILWTFFLVASICNIVPSLSLTQNRPFLVVRCGSCTSCPLASILPGCGRVPSFNRPYACCSRSFDVRRPKNEERRIRKSEERRKSEQTDLMPTPEGLPVAAGFSNPRCYLSCVVSPLIVVVQTIFCSSQVSCRST